MQLRHSTTLSQPTEGPTPWSGKITAICYSPHAPTSSTSSNLTTASSAAQNEPPRLAICTVDRIIQIYDTSTMTRVDKFSTKPNDKGPKNYIVRAMAFCPEYKNLKLAVAQSDNIVFVYKWQKEEEGEGEDNNNNASTNSSMWTGKKSICNKFPGTSPITSLIWPLNHPHEIIYSLAEGKVKLGQLRTNKPQTLYTTNSYCCALASHPSGDGVLSAHLDGSIYRYYFPSSNRPGPVSMKIVTHTSVAYALAWGNSICAAGNDRMVSFYDHEGNMERTFNYDEDGDADEEKRIECKEFTVAAFNLTGDSVAVGNFDSIYTFSSDTDSNSKHNNNNSRKSKSNTLTATTSWKSSPLTIVENMYSLTAMCWKSDGSELCIGTLCGLVDVYSACVKRFVIRRVWECTYVSPSQVLIRNNNVRLKKAGSASSAEGASLFRSRTGDEIYNIKIKADPDTKIDRFVVGNTSGTLLLMDMNTNMSSEVPWNSPPMSMSMVSNENNNISNENNNNNNNNSNNNHDNVKYLFDTPGACLIAYAGELSIVEYGKDEVLASVRTEYTSSHLLSVRLNERTSSSTSSSNKKVAYLLDTHTVSVTSLTTRASTTISHSSPLDFLELNTRGTLLLFRDKRRNLHLYDIDKQERTALLEHCDYVQWVPNSDVVVAQNRGSMCVWYNIHATDQVTMRDIKGDIDGIERANGKTEVLVDETTSVSSYTLIEELIDFGSAIEDRDYNKAVRILEGMEISTQAEAMWRQLESVCITDWNLLLAERCAAALGDVSRARYLHKVAKLAKEAERQGVDAKEQWKIRARMHALSQDLSSASDVLVSHNKITEAVEMYEELLMFSEALSVAERKNHPDKDEKRRQFYTYLIENKQEEEAAQMKETEGEYVQAINLYLTANMPGKAARVIADNDITTPNLLETVARALEDADMHEKAGDFYVLMGQRQRALDAFIKSHAYRKAVEMARKHFPQQVVALEEAWGDHLVSVNQIDLAISHYMEAHAHTKAVAAAIKARQWSKALTLCDQLDRVAAAPFYKALAEHYRGVRMFKEAEKCYVNSDNHAKAVDMWTAAGEWESAHRIAKSFLPEAEITKLYLDNAGKMEKAQKFKEAEKLYLAVAKPDHAIAMYKRHRKFDLMITLVAKHRKELLGESHKYLAQQLEVEGNLRSAEEHYAEAGEWLAAVNMYRSNDQWEEAIRVAKFHGGINASKRVAYAYALHLGGAAGGKVLVKLNLLEPAIDYAMESGAFDHAFELAKESLPKKVPEVHLKYALYLEDEERFPEAETSFLNASKPREAIDMYLHQQSWVDAIRVAEQHDPSAVPDVYASQAKAAAERGDYARGEEMYVAASKPDLALTMYEDAGLWSDAIRVARRHLPHKLAEVNLKVQAAQAGDGTGGTKADYISQGRKLEKTKKYSNAIDAYLLAKKDVLSNVNDLEEVWEQAVRVARVNCKNRYMEVARLVSQRLVEIKKIDAASELLREVDLLDEAVTVAITGKAWEKAREVAAGNKMLKARVESALQGHLVKASDTDGLMELGDAGAALDVLAQRGDWDRLWETAVKEKVSSNVVLKYSVMRVQQLVDDGGIKLDAAVDCLTKHGAPASPAYYDMYHDLVCGILGRDQKQEEMSNQGLIVSQLRQVLYDVALQLRSSSKDGKLDNEFENLLMATHYASMAFTCAFHGLHEMACKCAITLLRYSPIIPTDKAFHNAGMLAKKQGHTNLAFMLLNRFVDLIEAIEEGDSSNIDNADFADATNVPFDSALPTFFYVSEHEKREEVRDWVLAVCMDSSISQKLPRAGEAEGTTYAGLYATDKNGSGSGGSKASCIVTGYACGAGRDAVSVNGSVGNRREWNALVAKSRVCPWTGAEAQPQW